MKRTKGERIAATEKVIAKRLRQLKTSKSSVPHPHRLADASACGRCGHKRCICHYSQRHCKHPRILHDAPANDFE